MLTSRIWLLAAFLCLSMMYVLRLDGIGMVGPDEPRYAAIAQEMARSGDWITPRLWGAAWFEKPALLYWLSGLGYALHLPGEWAPRLPVALLSLCFLVAFYSLVRMEWSEDVAALAVMILATSASWLAFSQLSLTDLPLTVFFTLGLLLVIHWHRTGDVRALYAAAASFALAILAKGLVPIVLLAPGFLLLIRRWRALLLPSLFGLLVALPWYALCTVQNGRPFLEEFFWRHHFQRFASDELQHLQPIWFYAPVLLAALFPWTPLLFALRRSDIERFADRLLFFTAAFGFVFFSLAKNKLPSYLLPILPILCILIAKAAIARFTRAYGIAVGVLLGLIPVVIRILPVALEQGIRRTPLATQWPWLLAPVLSGILAAFILNRIRLRPALAIAAATILGAVLVLKTTLYPDLDRRISARMAWQELSGQSPPCLKTTSRSWRYSFDYYAQREVPVCPPAPRP